MLSAPGPGTQNAERRAQSAEVRNRRPDDFSVLNSSLCVHPSAFCLLPSAFCLLPSAFICYHSPNPPNRTDGREGVMGEVRQFQICYEGELTVGVSHVMRKLGAEPNFDQSWTVFLPAGRHSAPLVRYIRSHISHEARIETPSSSD